MSNNQMFQERLTRSSLGRLGFIGELYDVRTESFSSRSLFKSSLPQNLIESRDMGQMEFEYKFTENLSDRFEIMNIEAELQLNIILGIINLEGSGKFLAEEKKSEAVVTCTLICKLLNVSDKLFTSFEEILPHIDLTSLNDPQNTHVIIEVNWGANCLLSLESSCGSSKEKEEIKGALAGKLKTLKSILSVQTAGSLQKELCASLNNKNVHIKICADIISDKGWPTTVEGFCNFVLEVPTLLKNVNNGKGKPLSYAMIPLTTLKKLANLESEIDTVVKKIDESFLISTIYFFEEISEIKQKFHDVVIKMTTSKKYVTEEMFKKTKKQLENLSIKESELKSFISEDWVLVKSGKKKLNELIRKVEKFKNHDLNLFNYEDFLDSCDPVLKKISVVNNYISKGIIYLGKGEKLDDVMADNLSSEFYVLVISSKLEKADPELYSNTCRYFLSLAQHPTQTETKYVVVDLDFTAEEKSSYKEITKAKCYHIKGSQTLSSDVFGDYCEDLKKNFARLGKESGVEYISHKPGNRVVLKIRCPGFEAGSCTPDPLEWSCFRCKDALEYGFDNYFYCFCGKGPADSFEFRCNNAKHGCDFIVFKPKILENVLSNLRPLEELNILVLGQSGVGKSTWINSIINYLTYDSLDIAEEKGVISPIPMSFVMYDAKTLKKHTINVGDPSEREVTTVGDSGTQFSHTYSFLWEDRCVRIIDTPGLGDTRGIAQDKENLKNVIEHLGYIKELHGVCILLKANDNRITALFSYCLKELLAHLHKSVAKNIVFCFTNARNSLYSPGQTSALLEKEIENIGIKKDMGLGRHNMFCLDNEALMFLCSLKNPEINHDEILVKSFAQSWEISLKETRRLFNTVKTFQPHLLKETISLVTARSRVLTLTQPLSEVAKTIQINVARMEEKNKEISEAELTIEELSKRLKITEIRLEPQPLDYPRTVCTSSSCVEYVYNTTLDISEIEYKTHCHKACYLKHVTPKTVNNAELKHCDAMKNGVCTVCGCRWEKHMHLKCYQKRVEKITVNKKVEKDILKEKTEQEKIINYVNQLKDTIEKYKKEHEIIIQTCVKFGMFLRNNAISLYNDSVEDYLNYLIHTEEKKHNRSKTEEVLLQKLKETLNHYKTETKILNEVIQRSENDSEELTVQDVYDLEQQLYSLELTGAEIKRSVDISRSANQKMFEYGETPIQLSKRNHNKESNREKKQKIKKFLKTFVPVF